MERFFSATKKGKHFTEWKSGALSPAPQAERGGSGGARQPRGSSARSHPEHLVVRGAITNPRRAQIRG